MTEVSDHINGCDSFPDGIGSLSWRACCDAHDVAYTMGGDWLARVVADGALGWCVATSSWWTLPVGATMAAGVLVFGWAFYRYRGLGGANISEIMKERLMTNDNKDVMAAVRQEAQENGWPEAHLGAVVMAESGGKFWVDVNGERKVPMLFEPHVLYRLTSGEVRDRLVAEKLASPKWNKKLYAKTVAGRWKQLQRAVEIAGPVAFEAASYGAGQVLGNNWKSLGYKSILDFVEQVTKTARGQIDAMTKFIKVNGLDDELVEGRWDSFARGYNGPGYKKNDYANKMARFAAQWGGDVARPDGMLRMGAKGKRVRELQQLLRRANYYSGNIDGDFGTATKESVMAFQKAHRLKADGVYGPQTERILSSFRQAGESLGAEKVVEVKEVKEGGIVAGGGAIAVTAAKDALEQATEQLSPYSGMSGIVDFILTALTVLTVLIVVGGVAWGIYGWLKSKRTVEV